MNLSRYEKSCHNHNLYIDKNIYEYIYVNFQYLNFSIFFKIFSIQYLYIYWNNMRRMKIQFYTNFQILFSINFNVKREREKYILLTREEIAHYLKMLFLKHENNKSQLNEF